jgi:hypothetical protein
MENELLFKDECYAIQGAIFDVYKELGVGFLESVYQECLERELLARNIPFQAQRLLRLGLLVNFGSFPKATVERIIL